MQSNKSILVIGIIIVVLLGGGVWYFSNSHKAATETSTPVTATASPTPEATPPDHFPVPDEEAEQQSARSSAKTITKLPNLDESDETLKEELSKIADSSKLEDLVIFKNLIRSMVVFVDNLSTSRLSKITSPLNQPEGDFKVSTDGTMSPENYSRYTPYVELAESVDLKKLRHMYVHFYPLFQKAYADLGNSRYFNDHLISTIDLLLTTPTPKGPLHMNKLVVTYEFTDPDLEKLSIGQKILIRMGPENEDNCKKILKNLRGVLAHLKQEIK
ncbi:MAG TPA: DUF3014 domain-containing protein [Bdellovibrio sp.]|uniref:DUF3014 domain-containing protein n=1 Tax=Bdellovibrio sp. TaxID=28201 RepID=UPI002EE50129